MSRLYMHGKRAALALITALLVLPLGCNQFDERGLKAGLKEGINYLQPMKWRWTTRFRVQEVKPKQRLLKSRVSAWDPGVPAVGKGNYEIWMTMPREGETMVNVKEVHASPKPTAIEQGKNTDATFYYYNFTPDGYLPREMQAEVTWEFVTFEQYTYLPDITERPEYDKTSALYKEYTRIESPYTYNPRMAPILKDCKDPNDPHDYTGQAQAAYNYLCTKFLYDESRSTEIEMTGLTAMTDAYRAFENHKGVSNEITNVYVSMLRHMGIPARPVIGYVHPMDLIDSKENIIDTKAAAHIWAEFYLPQAGWVPVDATWGATGADVQPSLSLVGSMRKMRRGDYYFGRSDSFRCVLYKDVDYTLQPAPKTPGAKATEVWNTGYAERSSGIEKVVYGWEGAPGRGYANEMGWARSKSHEGYNFDIELTMVGPPSDAELKELRTQLAEKEINFLPTPPIKIGNLPLQTHGDGVIHIEKEKKEL